MTDFIHKALYDKMHRLETIKIVKNILEKNKIFFWLDFGSLLGAIRNNDLLGWDNEFDISIFDNDKEKIKNLFPLFIKRGFTIEYGHGENNIQIKRGTYKIDFNIYNSDEKEDDFIRIWNIHSHNITGKILDRIIRTLYKVYLKRGCKSIVSVTPPIYFSSFEQMKFLGESWNIPNYSERYLELHYGKNWKTPKKDYNFVKEDGTIQRRN